jgi:tripartite-type tricarboxylate transporter receptor subunit TctC
MMTRLSVALAFAMWAAVAGAHAQSYPSRPVTVIVPFAAGGVTDIVARIVSERMKTALGQSVIIENVSGAGGTIGVTRLFRAAPDGYTLVVGQWTSHVGAGAMYPVPFDYLNDFEPVSMLSLAPLWIVGRSSLPAKDLRELIAWLKANPDKASAATHRARERHPYVPGLFPEYDRHQVSARALSRCRAADAGYVGRADRSVMSGGGADAAAIPCRQYQSLCSADGETLVRGARCADHR